MTTPVFLTVDTEFAWRHHSAGHDVDGIYSRSLEPAGVGLSYQLDRLAEHGLKACFFVDPMPALVFGMAIGWVRSLCPAPRPAAAPRGAGRYLGPLLGVLALGIALAVIGPDLGRKWEGAPLDAQEQAHNRGTLWPRLWAAGYF